MRIAVKKFPKTLMWSLMIVFLTSGCISAQEKASIKGVVMDTATELPLMGANIYLDGTSIGTASGLDGDYVISNIPPGMYLLKIKYIGYQDFEIMIRLNIGQTLQQDAKMSFVAVKGDVVTVTGQAVGQLAAINQQLSSRTIKNVVAAERIQEIPDANAAESIGRLPGISIIRSGGEGNKVAIRGMSPKYNLITINGVKMASTAQNDRSVSLSMIGQNLLSSIEVSKAITPDMDADAIGGVVNLKLKEADKGLHVDALLQGGYNEQNNVYNNYKTYFSISDRFLNDRIGIIGQLNAERVNRGSDVFDASYGLQSENWEGLAPIHLNNINLIDRKTVRYREGVSLILDYQYESGKLVMSNILTQSHQDQIQRQNRLNLEGRAHDYVIDEQNDTKTTVLNHALQGSHLFSNYIKLDYGVSYMQSDYDAPENRQWNFKELTSFGEVDRKSAPDEIVNSVVGDLDETYLSIINYQTVDRTEKQLSSNFDVTLPVRFNKVINGEFKLGGKYTKLERSNDVFREERNAYWGGDEDFRDIIITNMPELGLDASAISGQLPATPFTDFEFDAGEFLGGDYELGWTPQLALLDKAFRVGSPLFQTDMNGARNNYKSLEDNYAGYMMAEINMGEKFKFIPGVRYERIELNNKGKKAIQFELNDYIIEDTSATQIHEYFFPMFHMQYKGTEWFDIRFAATRTMTRPDYLAVIPFVTSNGDGTQVRVGNINLTPATAYNYDLYWSVYNNIVGLFTIGGFYKKVDDLIWQTAYTALTEEDADIIPFAVKGAQINTYLNNDYEATVKGIEIDLQTNFWYLPSPFDKIVLSANYSHISSETKYPRTMIQQKILTQPPWIEVSQVDTFRTGRMVNQPDDIVNLAIGYDIGGFSARLSFLYQGKSLESVQDRPEQDGFRDDYYRWDLSIKQNLYHDKIQLLLNINNINNATDKSLQSTLNYLDRQEYYGRTIDLGIRYRL